VINAMNEDKPYDKFVVEQLAADRIPDISPDDPRLATPLTSASTRRPRPSSA